MSSLLTAGALVFAPAVAVVTATIALGFGIALLWPRQVVLACLVLPTLYAEIFLYYRVSPGGLPVSPIDLIPPLLLISALSLRRREGTTRSIHPLLKQIIVLATLGLVVGSCMGLLRGASLYDLLRIVRVEAGLVTVLCAAGLAAHVPIWRQSVVTGLYVGGLLVAFQLIISYAWIRATGDSFWAQFPFGQAIGDVSGPVISEDFGAIRAVGIPGMLMLPGLCLALSRLQLRDAAYVAVVLAAAAVSLTRSIWIATLFACITALAWHRPPTKRLVGAVALAAILVPIIYVTATYAGDTLRLRVSQDASAYDPSTSYRASEFAGVRDFVAGHPDALVVGAGAGVTIPHKELAARPQEEQTSLLENSLLSRWMNLTIFSLVATGLLLLGAFVVAWRHASQDQSRSAYYAMAACLPVIFFAGLFSGSVSFILQGSLPIWALAATVFTSMTGGEARLPESEARIPSGLAPVRSA